MAAMQADDFITKLGDWGRIGNTKSRVQQLINAGRTKIRRRHADPKRAPQLSTSGGVVDEQRLAKRKEGRFRQAHATSEIRRALAMSFKPAVEHARGMLHHELYIHGRHIREI